MIRIEISGQVQGVGFRPHVYKLAKQLNLRGEVYNNENGVVIHLDTSREKADDFAKRLASSPPISAVIDLMSVHESSVKKEFSNFSIIQSSTKKKINTPLTPDLALCSRCRSEIDDPTNRRYQYPFTTCVDCGPRYSITDKFPFERHHTTVRNKSMCEVCNDEYDSFSSIRFHSQTNTCSMCGFTLKYRSHSTEINGDVERILKEIKSDILRGWIVAIKNTNGYILCCDASNPKAVTTLRARKRRPHKPFALLYPCVERIEEHYHLSLPERECLQSPQAPIVVLKDKLTISSHIAKKHIAPDTDYTAVMLPHSSLLHLIMKHIEKPMVATSANIHGSPIIYTEKGCHEGLCDVADSFLHNSLDISFPQDDSVVKFQDKNLNFIRRSRGFAPNALSVKPSTDLQILAMGGMLKSAFCFIPNERVYVSPYLGDLSSYDVFCRYRQTIDRYIKLFDTEPELILTDLHPEYPSTQLGQKMAKGSSISIKQIPHHEAHLMSVIGENNLLTEPEPILGVIWDGAGMGTDGSIWGGEFFMYHNFDTRRVAHFDSFEWIAGDKMSRSPNLSLLSTLPKEERRLIKNKFSENEYHIYTRLLENNQLKTSSVGRIFDAVACILNLIEKPTYEGQAAILVEHCALQSAEAPTDYLSDCSATALPTHQLISTLLNEKQKGVSKPHIARSFIFTMARRILSIANHYHIKKIACSGGVFQNHLLIKLLRNLCEKHKISPFFNINFASNDENISIGQYFHYSIKK